MTKGEFILAGRNVIVVCGMAKGGRERPWNKGGGGGREGGEGVR